MLYIKNLDLKLNVRATSKNNIMKPTTNIVIEITHLFINLMTLNCVIDIGIGVEVVVFDILTSYI